jgi:hypothetical protein
MDNNRSDRMHISEFSDMPPFVEPLMCADDPEMVNGVDGWSVRPIGDWGCDWALGKLYADVHARATEPAFISFVLASILCKARHGLLKGDGAIESGFYDRIARLACAGALN